MRTVRTVAELRELLAPDRRAGRAIGLVPTMGFFHDGHLSLMRRARADNDVLVVSLFVNPAQFAPGEDFSAYPRDEQRDSELAEAEGVDILFSPPVEEVYPDGFDTTVAVGGLTDTLEGDEAQRGAEHFLGVTTVVTKLFNMVGPGRCVLRPEGRPAGARDPQARPRPRHPGPDRGLPHDPRRRRAGAQLPQRVPEPRGARACPGPEPRPARRRGRRGRRDPRTRPRWWLRRARSLRAPGSNPTIFSSAPPRTSPPSSV